MLENVPDANPALELAPFRRSPWSTEPQKSMKANALIAALASEHVLSKRLPSSKNCLAVRF